MPVVSGFGSFSVFAAMYVAACDVLQRPADMVRLVDETADDAVAAGAVYIEPAIYLPHHRERLGPPEELIELILDASRAATERTGVEIGWMVAADRTLDPADAVAQAHIAERHAGKGVVSFGLANDELLGVARPLRRGLRHRPRRRPAVDAPRRRARRAPQRGGRHRAARGRPHPARGPLGRAARPAGAAGRQGRLPRRVPDLERAARRRARRWRSIPLPQLLEAGVRVSINADDPLLFGPGLLEEYELCRDAFGLDDLAMARIAATSIAASGACPNTKAEALNAIDEWLESGVVAGAASEPA